MKTKITDSAINLMESIIKLTKEELNRYENKLDKLRNRRRRHRDNAIDKLVAGMTHAVGDIHEKIKYNIWNNFDHDSDIPIGHKIILSGLYTINAPGYGPRTFTSIVGTIYFYLDITPKSYVENHIGDRVKILKRRVAKEILENENTN